MFTSPVVTLKLKVNGKMKKQLQTVNKKTKITSRKSVNSSIVRKGNGSLLQKKKCNTPDITKKEPIAEEVGTVLQCMDRNNEVNHYHVIISIR